MAYGRRKVLAKYATRALNATYRIKIRMSPFQGSFMRNAEIPRASPWAVSSGSVGATQEKCPNSNAGRPSPPLLATREAWAIGPSRRLLPTVGLVKSWDVHDASLLWVEFLESAGHDGRMEIQIGVTEPEYRKAQTVFSVRWREGCRCVPVPGEENRPLRRRCGARRNPSTSSLASPSIKAHSTRHLHRAASSPGSAWGMIGSTRIWPPGVESFARTHRAASTIRWRNMPSGCSWAWGGTLRLAARMAAGEWAPRARRRTRRGKDWPSSGAERSGGASLGSLRTRFWNESVGSQTIAARPPRELAGAIWFRIGLLRISTKAIASAKVVSLHLPGGPDTRHFLDTSRLAQLPPGCFVVNTARGSTSSTKARCIDALARRPACGCGPGCFRTRALRAPSPGKDLRQLPNVVMTPHTGSSTREACDRMARRALENIQWAVTGKYTEMDLLNPVTLKR